MLALSSPGWDSQFIPLPFSSRPPHQHLSSVWVLQVPAHFHAPTPTKSIPGPLYERETSAAGLSQSAFKVQVEPENWCCRSVTLWERPSLWLVPGQMLSVYESLTPTVARLLLPLLLLAQAAGKTLQLGCCMEQKVAPSLLLASDPLGALEVALVQEGLRTILGGWKAVLVLPCACRHLILPGWDCFPCWHYSCGISQKETTILNSQPKWCHFHSALRVIQWTVASGRETNEATLGWMLWCWIPGVPRLLPLSQHGFSVLLSTQLWQDSKAVGIFENSALLTKLAEISQGVHKFH